LGRPEPVALGGVLVLVVFVPHFQLFKKIGVKVSSKEAN
jgi:hypothetical protein